MLSDPTSRSLYDRYGAEGMRSRSGADSGRGNARQVAARPLPCPGPFVGLFVPEQALACVLGFCVPAQESRDLQSEGLVHFPLPGQNRC